MKICNATMVFFAILCSCAYSNPIVDQEICRVLNGVYNDDVDLAMIERTFSWGPGEYSSHGSIIIDCCANPPYISIPGFSAEIVSVEKLANTEYWLRVKIPETNYSKEIQYELQISVQENERIVIQGESPFSTSVPYFKISGPEILDE